VERKSLPELSPDEIARRRDAALARALTTPPTPHKTVKPKRSVRAKKIRA
jgi:hypothetical protein